MTTSDFDTSVRPQDDLHGYVNAAWLKNTEIPADRAGYGSFDILREAAEANVRALIEEAAAGGSPDGEARKIGDLYASFMDETAVETAGAGPLALLFDRIAAITDRDGLAELLGELPTIGVMGPLAPFVTIDRGEPSRYLVHLYQAGLGLPDESYYRLEEHAEIRSGYAVCITTMLGLAGLGGEAEAATILAFETSIATAHWDRTALRDVVKTYNLTTAAELTAVLPAAPRLFAAVGMSADQWQEVVVGQPDVVAAVSGLLESGDLATWKLYLSWRALQTFAPYLSSGFVDAHFEFFGKTLSGTTVIRDRWKRGVGVVEGVLGEAVGKLYVEKFYPPASAAAMQVLVENLLAAYGERIATLDWMAEETRTRALGKLSQFRPKIGKPVHWRDYGDLVIDRGDLVGNVQRANAFDYAWMLGKLSGPVDKDEWFLTPQTVNAYYNPMMNEIVFPAAILQPPFFDPALDSAYNYGAIGAVIGHEIGHGFDDQGSRFDGDGTMRDWWTAEDRERFDVRVKALVEQYDGFSPRALDGHKVNGAFTVGENIGDLGGVAVAYHAYRLSLGGDEAPVIDGLTGDRRFFIGWALIWRAVTREQEAIRRLTIDPHSPSEFRTNVVRNVDAFHEAFETKPGDGLWLEPAERIAIW